MVEKAQKKSLTRIQRSRFWTRGVFVVFFFFCRLLNGNIFFFLIFFFVSLFFYFFKFYFIFRLYITVLVLPNIKMNPPQVYNGNIFEERFN